MKSSRQEVEDLDQLLVWGSICYSIPNAQHITEFFPDYNNRYYACKHWSSL